MNINIAIAQLRPKKGNYAANVARLGELFAQLGDMEPQPDVLVLAETALTGYFLEGGVREVALSAGELFTDLQEAYLAARGPDAPPLDVVVGFYELYRDHFYNSALYATLGSQGSGVRGQGSASQGSGVRGQGSGGEGSEDEFGLSIPDPRSLNPGIRHVHRKVFLPTYGVFDEARFVEAGHHIAAFETRLGRAAILICEDAWHSISGTVAALDGAQIVYVVSASPARGNNGTRPSNVEHWEDLVRRICDEHGVFGVLAQLIGFEGGKGFPGASFVMGPRGNVRVCGPLWREAIVQATIDLDDLPLARADLPLLADLESILPHVERELARAERGERALVGWGNARRRARSGANNAAPPARPGGPFTVVKQAPPDLSGDLLKIDPQLTREWLVEFLRDEVQRRRGFQQVLVGLSGGVDSALTTYLCAEAFGPERVFAIRMPYRTSSRESLDHAQLVIDDLGLRSTTVDISDAVDAYARLDPEMDGRRKGNVMARMRMIVLFDYSQKLGAIPIGTGNKTERLFGYFTWHADDSPPVNPLGDLFKSQVWQLAQHVGVPAPIVEKPASADLIVGQTDEADFGISYPRADTILHFLLQGYSLEKLVAMGFTETDILLVKRRVDSTHWKRRLPSTAMLSTTAIGEYYLRPVDY